MRRKTGGDMQRLLSIRIIIAAIFVMVLCGCDTDTEPYTDTNTNENTTPVADNQTVSVFSNTPVSITLTGSDADSDALTYVIAVSPSHGSLSGTAPGLTYTPGTDYSGSDSFTFTVSDGTETSAAATVTISVQEGITLSVEAHSENTLMAIAQAVTGESASVVIEYSSTGTATRQTVASGSGTDHTIAVIGMRASTIYTMAAVATLSDGSVVRSNSVDFTTGVLPETPPTVSVTTSTSQSAGGITFLGSVGGQNESSLYWGFDEEG